MKRTSQISFSDPRLRSMKAFGGALLRDKKNRGARPLSSRHPVHLVFKSSRATGNLSFLRPRSRRILQASIKQMSQRYGLRVLETGICGNHFHLLVKFQNRRLLIQFLRVFTGTLVRRLCGSAKLTRRFFDYRPFSRVVIGRQGYRIARDYVLLNQLERLGLIPYQKDRLRGEWRRDWPPGWGGP